MDDRENSSSSSNWVSLLGVAFIVLKLTGVITWSWWWVLAPFWGGIALVLMILLVIGVFRSIVLGIMSLIYRRR